MKTRTEFAQHLLDDFSSNDWGGDAPVLAIATGMYAVRIERDDDSWILGASDGHELAAIALACIIDTQGYDEWVSDVWSMETQKPVAFQLRTTVEIALGDGVTGIAADRLDLTTPKGDI